MISELIRILSQPSQETFLLSRDYLGDGQFTGPSGGNSFSFVDNAAKLNGHSDAKNVNTRWSAKQIEHGTPLYEYAVAVAKNPNLLN